MSLKWDSELDELRIRRRTEILDEARELFLEKGLPRVTMRDISKEVGVSTVTLYKYYKSVDEIAGEVKRQILIEMKQFFNEISNDITAYEQIINWLKQWDTYLKEKDDHIRFQAEFDLYYQSQKLEIEQVYYLELIKINGESIPLVFEQGQKEGSIRTDFTANDLTAWTFNNILGMVHRLAARGPLLENESRLSTEKMMEMTIDSVANFIRRS